MNETIYAFLHMYIPVAIFAAGLIIGILCFLQIVKFCLKLPFADAEDNSGNRCRRTLKLALYLAILLISSAGLVLSAPRVADIRAVLAAGDFHVASGLTISQDHPDFSGQRDRTGSIMTIVVKARYTNLIPGQAYVVIGTLMDDTKGEPIRDAEGNIITAKVRIVPKKTTGKIKMTYTFNGKNVSLSGAWDIRYTVAEDT